MTKVLVVDDNAQLREALTERLSFFDDLEVVGAASDGSEALTMAGDLRPDVIIMDVQMPNMDGIEATRRIHEMDPGCQIVAHTAFEDSALVSEMIKAGAKGYLLKGGKTDEIINAIHSVTSGQSVVAPKAARPLLDDLEALYRREQDRRRELERLVEQLRALVDTDYLTGLSNHQHFHSWLEDALGRADSHRSRLAVVRINLDDFHLVNDRFGHVVGDTVLAEVGQRIAACCPEGSARGRTGGEEFMVALPGATHDEAMKVAETCLEAIRVGSFGLVGELTASAGVAVYPDDAAGRDALLACTERALRAAKSRGKDAVQIYVPGLNGASKDVVAREAQMRAIFALARAVDARDPYTGMHSQRLARYARSIASGMGIHDERLAVIRASALLHDVGKIGVRDGVLLKPSHLDPPEFAEMMEHPVLGEKIVLGAVDRQVSRAIRHHHERIDGSGYPDGLKGEDIPLASRILLVADAFDAMTSDRIYRKALPLEKAMDELRQYAGKQFDCDVVGAAIPLIESGEISVLD